MYVRLSQDHANLYLLQFKTLYDAQRGRLVSAELFQYDDVLKTVENAMVAFKEQLTITRQRLASYLPAFRILEQPQVCALYREPFRY